MGALGGPFRGRFGVAARAFVAFVALFVGTPLPVQRVREAPSSQPFEFQSLDQVDASGSCGAVWHEHRRSKGVCWPQFAGGWLHA